jgi:DNA-binding response OmpR family regulator
MRILLVEDERKLANAIIRALKLQNYAADTAYDGTTGLDLAIGESFDLILLDVMLPGINGIELCRQIRENGVHTPILILTAKGQVADKVIGLDVGADDYMVKPFSFEELFARIRALIRRPQEVNQPVLKINNLTLNPLSYEVQRNTHHIQLSAKEFAILEYLMRQKNTVVTRDQLIAHIWNYDTNILPNVVEVHIKHIRDKIDEPHSVSFIQTVRGRGYCIKDT